MDAVPHVAEGGDGDADRLVLVVEGGVICVVDDVHGGRRRGSAASVRAVFGTRPASSLKVNNFFHVNASP